MSTATKSLLTARLDGTKIELRGPTSLNEFFRTLPNGRWSGKRLAWECDATPAAAYRVSRESYGDVQCDEGVLQLSVRFLEQQAVDLTGDLPQPELRHGNDWPHQLRAYHFANPKDAAMLALGMGLGKSRVTVNLLVNWNCRVSLILCPASVLGVWRREINRHAATKIETLILEKTSTTKKTKEAATFVQNCRTRNLPCAIVVNYETARMDEFLKWALSVSWDAVVCDESQRIKTHSSASSKAAWKIGRKAKRRLCLTGTPMPHSPLDVFGQMRFLDSGLLGTSFQQFRNQYAIVGPLGPGHIVGFKNQEQLAEKLKPLMLQITPAEANLSLPPVTHHEIGIGLKSYDAYHELENEMILAVEAGVVTVSNALVKLLRLQQITSGFVVDDDENERWLSTEKKEELTALLADLNGIDPSHPSAVKNPEPVVVFCWFKRELSQVQEVAEKLKLRYGEISGNRKDLTPDATMPEDVDVLGVQIASGGVGIDLTRAHYAVYFSHGWSLGNYEQSLARLDRPGQRCPVIYYHFLVEGTVDVAVWKSLRKKREVVDGVLNYLKGDGDE